MELLYLKRHLKKKNQISRELDAIIPPRPQI